MSKYLSVFKFALSFFFLFCVSHGHTQAARPYLDIVYPEVKFTKDVNYSQVMDNGHLIRLRLDIYEPKNDQRTNRPLLILVHGGGFYTGDKGIFGGTYTGIPGEKFGWGDYFAKRGYVVMSLNYRLTNTMLTLDSPNLKTVIDKAVSDVRSGIRFAKKNAATYRIDPQKVAVAGQSAGAILALHVAFDHSTQNLNPTNPGVDHLVQAAASLAGAILPPYLSTVSNPSGAKAIMFHGTKDTVVDYSWAYKTYQKLNTQMQIPISWHPSNEGHTVSGHLHKAPEIAQFFYDTLQLSSNTANTKPGDLTGDSQVNILDFNLLVQKFGNPYTILDFNSLVANFGK